MVMRVTIKDRTLPDRLERLLDFFDMRLARQAQIRRSDKEHHQKRDNHRCHNPGSDTKQFTSLLHTNVGKILLMKFLKVRIEMKYSMLNWSLRN